MRLCHPMDCRPPGFSLHGILQARILEWEPCLPPGDLLDQGIKPTSLMFSALASGVFFSPLVWPGKPDEMVQFSSVQPLSRVRLFATPWIAARQAFLSITNSRSSLKLTSIESVMSSSHLILCCPLLLLPTFPPSIRVFSNESTLHLRWPKYWSFSFSIIPSKEIPGLISFRMDCEEGWAPNNWCFWTVVLEKTPESPLYC